MCKSALKLGRLVCLPYHNATKNCNQPKPIAVLYFVAFVTFLSLIPYP